MLGCKKQLGGGQKVISDCHQSNVNKAKINIRTLTTI